MIAVAAALCMVGVIGTMLYFTYGLANHPPAQAVVPGLADSAFVVSYDNGSASVQAQSRGDAFAALGYLHAAEHAWTMTLWQRTARGQLSAWLGDELLPLDRLTRELGLGVLAEQSYRALPEDERGLLDAYARGANAALIGTRRAGEFSVLETAPDLWQPWYALAVDRLFAWLATEPPPSDSLLAAPEGVRTFYEADAYLRRWLHVHGFDASMVWTFEDSSGTSLTQRYTFGASALPTLQEVEILYPDARVAGATLIGTPFMFAGRSDTHAWSILLASTVEIGPSMLDTSAATRVYEKLESAEGREYILEIMRDAGELFFEEADSALPLADTSAVDSAGAPLSNMQSGWALRWAGMEPISDAAAWLALPSEPSASFQVYEGDGLVMSRDGSAQVVGSPQFIHRHARGIAVGNSPWSRFAAERLDSLDAAAPSSLDEPVGLNDYHSTWAASLAPALTDAAVSVPDQPPLVTDALAFLRNWDYRYDRASIAASIFDTWTQTYRDSLGLLPEASVPDSALEINLVRYEILVEAVADLAERFGEDPSQWRWEEIEPHRYFFPVWSSDSLTSVDLSGLAATRYAPIDLPGAGHATTLDYGPSRIRPGPDGPAQWAGWTSTAGWDSFHFRTRRFPANRFFGRYLVSERIPAPAVVPAPGAVRYTTTLIPE